MKPTMSKTKFLALALIAVVGLSFGAIWIFKLAMGNKPYSMPWEQTRPRAEIEKACRKHVTEAEAKAKAAINRRVSEFSDFLNSRKSGARPFSKDIVSLYGKWRAVSPYLPFTDKNGYKKYIVEKFNAHIFTNEQLAAALKRAVEGSVRDLESIENELAVALRQEILGRSLKPDEVPIAAEEFKKAVERLVAASQWDAIWYPINTAGNLVVSEVATQVATPVLVRLGVSAGILSAGSANSWWSLGATLVIGMVVDVIWGWIDDPAGDIEREMISALDKLSIDASTAIKDEMNKVISQRRDLWNKTVKEILP